MNDEIKVKQYSAEICDLFEELLDMNDITIPDNDRTGDESEARIYGETWSELIDQTTDILCSLINKVKDEPNATINKDDY